MNPDDIKRLFPNASRSLFAANAQGSLFPNGCERESEDAAVCAKLERTVSNGALGKSKKKITNSERFLVRVTSIRKRLIDADNLSAKGIVDCVRYAGIVPDDRPETTDIQVTQRKPTEGEEEHTLIEIYQLTNKTL